MFANFVLADEINRAPAKVQSALLEVMAERQVSLGGITHRLPNPFLVLATQNPIESRGRLSAPGGAARPLPHAHPGRLSDRRRGSTRSSTGRRRPAVEPERLLSTRRRPPTPGDVRPRSDVDPPCRTTRSDSCSPAASPAAHGVDTEGLLAYGASPRASIGLVHAGQALALLRGRDHVLPQDVYDVAYDVLNHRLVLSFDAVADGITVDDVLVALLTTVIAPQLSSSELQTGAARRRR